MECAPDGGQRCTTVSIPFFPKADDLIQKMELVRTYKDVTFETLNREDFLPLIQPAFPAVNWHMAYKEFRAACEKAK